MPRRTLPARLYLDPKRREWIIRDRERFERTGCAEPDTNGANAALKSYLARNHRPQAGPDPLIADVLLYYASEHLPTTAARRQHASSVKQLAKFWSEMRVSDVTIENCRTYAAGRPQAAGSADMTILRAALNHWHKSKHGPLPTLPRVLVPAPPARRERWLTRGELARLLWAARRISYLRRFIVLAYYTGSRSGVVLATEWKWIDLETGHMRRRAPGEAERRNKKRPPLKVGRRLLGAPAALETA